MFINCLVENNRIWNSSRCLLCLAAMSFSFSFLFFDKNGNNVGCGGTIIVNGSRIFVGSCECPLVKVNWKLLTSLFLTKFQPALFQIHPYLWKWLVMTFRFIGTYIYINNNNLVLLVIMYSLILSSLLQLFLFWNSLTYWS